MREDLSYVWVCHECGNNFLFRSDAEDHVRMAGHKKIEKYEMEALTESSSSSSSSNSI
jgi:hypothetical protein